jgi:Tfp pilus assembly protein PilF
VEASASRNETALEPDHSDTVRVVQNLGMLYHGHGQVDEAEKMWKRALAGYEKALVPYHPETSCVLFNLGTFYANQG